jgi:metal-responsive CopG/Arc/MetJ family transcriptional regulator
MAIKQRHSFFIDQDLFDRLTAMSVRTGISRSEQVRRGIQLWLGSREWPASASEGRVSRLARRSLPPFLGLPPVADGRDGSSNY